MRPKIQVTAFSVAPCCAVRSPPQRWDVDFLWTRHCPVGSRRTPNKRESHASRREAATRSGSPELPNHEEESRRIWAQNRASGAPPAPATATPTPPSTSGSVSERAPRYVVDLVRPPQGAAGPEPAASTAMWDPVAGGTPPSFGRLATETSDQSRGVAPSLARPRRAGHSRDSLADDQ